MSATAFPKPVPKATPELAPFLEAAREGRLAVQRCTSCGSLRFPPRELCSRCWSREVEWTDASGRGEVFSFYVMHQVYHPGFAADVPYPVVVVKLEEGPLVVSNLVDCPRERLAVGLPVEVAFEEREGVALPVFRPRTK
ncbi:MAG: Zn-ribbon domain-containing OB-fold protein [Alphaproteobacteria bacterium]